MNDYLKMIDIGISQINQYVSKINLKQNSTEKINDLIKTTNQNIIDAFNYINDIKNFNYTSNIQKNQNINRANNLQREVNSKKDKLQKLMEEIKSKGEKYIYNARNSLKIIEEQERESSASNNLNNKNNNMNMEMKLINERDNIVEDIQEKQKLINYCAESINQINEITKFQNEKILEAGEKIDSIEDNIMQMSMNQAKKYNDEAGGYSNYCLYIIAGIVCLLILLVLIMPSS